MLSEKSEAAAGTTAPQRKTKSTGDYHFCPSPSSSKRAEKIAQRRSDMPRSYQAKYARAVSGKSLRAAVDSFCLECMMWQRNEVRKCTSLACPLWAYRPYKPQQKLQTSVIHKNGDKNVA
ncbi:hypothetical protein STSP2_01954 [Anaerohalosphaera lusitana]|uniref:Uncharacterized protein n=1 Tax=Anaerohalosphaera lusitana TaxID=1936003 RepID=A0A1U9NLH0_9BACT|nr:hypothetical protein STSP2_01954 [Anaerohalosphaera lusitana]